MCWVCDTAIRVAASDRTSGRDNHSIPALPETLLSQGAFTGSGQLLLRQRLVHEGTKDETFRDRQAAPAGWC